MDADAFKWISGYAMALALFGAGIMGMIKNLLDKAKQTDQKLACLKECNDSALREMMHSNHENTRSNQEMVHYMRWMAENLNGKSPPPYTGGRDTGGRG